MPLCQARRRGRGRPAGQRARAHPRPAPAGTAAPASSCRSPSRPPPARPGSGPPPPGSPPCARRSQGGVTTAPLPPDAPQPWQPAGAACALRGGCLASRAQERPAVCDKCGRARGCRNHFGGTSRSRRPWHRAPAPAVRAQAMSPARLPRILGQGACRTGVRLPEARDGQRGAGGRERGHGGRRLPRGPRGAPGGHLLGRELRGAAAAAAAALPLAALRTAAAERVQLRAGGAAAQLVGRRRVLLRTEARCTCASRIRHG